MEQTPLSGMCAHLLQLLQLACSLLLIISQSKANCRYFEIAVTLREAHLINGMLTSTDILYGLRNKEIEELEEVDKLLIRSILNAPISSCIESLYLELGLTPIRIILKSRRKAYYP